MAGEQKCSADIDQMNNFQTPSDDMSEPVDDRTKRIVAELQKHWITEYHNSRERALVELTEKLHQEFLSDQQKIRTELLQQFKDELEHTRTDLESKYRDQLKSENAKLTEKHRREMSEAKKKQWQSTTAAGTPRTAVLNVNRLTGNLIANCAVARRPSLQPPLQLPPPVPNNSLAIRANDEVYEGRAFVHNQPIVDAIVLKVSNPVLDGVKTRIILSIALKFYAELQQHGADDLFRRIYGGHMRATPESGFNVTLEYDLSALPDNTSELVQKASALKRNCFASVFEKYFEFQEAGQEGHKRAVINYREDETMYIEAKADRVTVIFSTVFKDADDVIIGKVFLQEFREGRKASQTAPAVLYSLGEPPLELKDLPGARVGDNVGYITFVLFPRHTNKKTRDNTIDLIHSFRDYLHYHIKCSKVYLHTRMRAKTTDRIGSSRSERTQ
ncbi:hypothetical protein GCK72_011860 [Caenorhabditis remanei]|uniref:Arp2/3 complex 34 kDa subunit n=1 Tax=Caenorhabditis remanei TaxID=31234 RepID=A0A6A5HAY1_CAERE|nr:hypothetical protein GCK72_011860 [Caenorhabditis remanei]KAF1763593.1 hypothetical protein GCK72_011860 [Caenorhabditis remanei]